MRVSSTPSCAVLLGAAFALVAVAAPAMAQFEACRDTIALYSPTGLTVTYEPSSNPQTVDGVRLRWDGVADSLAGCARIVIDPALESALGVEVRGDYRNRFDRGIDFSFTQAGQIGDPDQQRVELSVLNDHRNPAAGKLNSILNVSSAGGIYRFAPQISGNVAGQVNSGLPVHLGDLSINAFAGAADGSVLYVAVTGAPVLRSFDGGQTWEEPVRRIFPPFSQRMTHMVVFPDDPEHLWVGVNGRGVWESRDGAETWMQIFPAGSGPTSTVTAMKFLEVPDGGGGTVTRLYLGLKGQGLTFSDDLTVTFQSVGLFDVPSVPAQNPVGADCALRRDVRVDVFDVEQSPSDPGRIYVALERWGVYTGSATDHSVWTPRYDGLVICSNTDDVRTLGEQRTVVQLEVLDDSGTDVLVAITAVQGGPGGTVDLRSQTTAFISRDGGQSWDTKGDGFPLNPDGDPYAVPKLVRDPRQGANATGVIAATFGAGLWELTLLNPGPGQGNWVPVDFVAGQGIRNERTSAIYAAPNGDLLIGTSDSGVYTPGTWIDLTRALNRNAQSIDQVRTLGLEVRFTNPAMLNGTEVFSVKAQNFRGYAVWRATDLDRDTGIPEWELAGLLDLANPESCVESACDAVAQEPIVNCWAHKRANCFVQKLDEMDLSEDWEFFDRDIFNGYTYWYAVSTFDFGYTGETSPESFRGGMLFSPRWSEETDPAASLYSELAGGQNYNGQLFQVNVAAPEVLVEDEVFVVPNPLVRAAGWDLGGASSIRIVNVTSTSKVQIFTIAGDLVRELENVQFAGVERGNIEWDTRNADGEPVASGVYIYRLTDAKGGEKIGRFTIIR